MRKLAIVRIYFFGVVTMLLSSCINFHTNTVKDIIGKYIYEYKSGAVEVWTLRGDLSYEQELYANESDYGQSSHPLYSNHQSWKLDDQGIVFDHCLVFFDPDTPGMPFDKPQKWASRRGDWYPAGTQLDAAIDMATDIHYLLRRVKK
jgi:hypothetical protein